MSSFKNVLITGASSGLGRALALHYAKAGVSLHLQGRNQARLDVVSQECEAQGAAVYPRLLDVTDAQGMEDWLKAANAQTPIDLVIANAGISAGSGTKGETAQQARRIFATNVDGVLNTVQPLMSAMLARKSGHIAIISSLAGIRALPSCPSYSASKACVRYYGESLRGWLGAKGVNVSVICPGYITTPMTRVNNFPMPFIMSAEKAAGIIAKGLEKNRARIAFPLPLYLPLWFLSCLSVRITDPFFSRLPAKPNLD
jgi:short-subunit dehydrogenase